MSTISKHFGLSYREESYLLKELEKVRRKTKKDFLQFKQKLAAKTLVDGVPGCGPGAPGPARSGEKGSVSCAGPRASSGFPWAKGPETPEADLLQDALRRAAPWGPREGAAPWRPRRFRPRDFYLRSSAFLRHRPLREPPVIATGAGTSRPVVLRPPPASRRKPGERPGRWSPQAAEAPPELDAARAPGPAPAPAQSPRAPAAAPAEASAAAEPKRRRSTSSEDEGEAEAASQRRRVRIRSHVPRESLPREAPRAFSKTSADLLQPSDRLAAAVHTPLPVRVIPTSIEEIIASLQSEAQLASDQTIRELIQSVLGQNYDINMEVGAEAGGR